MVRLVSSRVQSLFPLLLDISSGVAELDILLSWSSLCSECGFTRPAIVDEAVINVIVTLFIMNCLLQVE